MPRFLFHVRDGIRTVDDNGKDLPDLRAARLEAVRLTERLLLEHHEANWINEDWKIVVTDEARVVVFVLQISAIFDPLQIGMSTAT